LQNLRNCSLQNLCNFGTRRPYSEINRRQTCQPPKHANLETLKKKPRKTWRLVPQTWRFPKYLLNENKNGRSLVSRYSLPYLCYLLHSFAAIFRVTFCFAVDATRQFELTIHSSSFPRDLAHLCFTGMRLELYPGFPQT